MKTLSIFDAFGVFNQTQKIIPWMLTLQESTDNNKPFLHHCDNLGQKSGSFPSNCKKCMSLLTSYNCRCLLRRNWEASEPGEPVVGAKGQHLNFRGVWAMGCLCLTAEIPPLRESTSVKRRQSKTNRRWRREGVEDGICVRLAGARRDMVRSGFFVNSLHICFGWVNSLTQQRGKTDFLLKRSLWAQLELLIHTLSGLVSQVF